MLTIEHPLSKDILPIIRPWYAEGKISIPVTLNSDWTNIASYDVESTDHAFLTGFGYEVEDPTYDYSGSLQFRITLTQQPLRDFDNFQLQSGTPQVPFSILVNLKPNDQIAFQARRAVVAPLPQFVSANLRGVAWPQKYCLPFNSNPSNGQFKG